VTAAEIGTLVDAARSGDRSSLARLLTIVENGGDGAREAAAVLGSRHFSAVLGITGAPGAGKSTLTDGLVGRLRSRGERVAVLAIDPTSPFTGGAILGDRIRMQSHDTDEGVFVRSMASRGHLGGLSRATDRRRWTSRRRPTRRWWS
jgi:LAO/AO transport system kinase